MTEQTTHNLSIAEWPRSVTRDPDLVYGDLGTTEAYSGWGEEDYWRVARDCIDDAIGMMETGQRINARAIGNDYARMLRDATALRDDLAALLGEGE